MMIDSRNLLKNSLLMRIEKQETTLDEYSWHKQIKTNRIGEWLTD